ncbi:MAG: GGDEF domain-containing protein [Deltaproteobacteria bacterium]|nr:GGDEF domain-containing protein [Deltaproteobacteria bacterium]
MLSYEAVETKRRRLLAEILMIIGVVVLAVLGVTAHVQNNPVLGIVDHVTALLMSVGFVYLARGGNLAIATYCELVVLGLLILYLLITGGVAWTAYMWTFVYPVATVYLIGSRWGTIYSVMVFVVFLVTRYGIPELISDGHPYRFDFVIRFGAVYCVVLLISLYYENSRTFASKRIKEHNETLRALSSRDGLTGIRNRRYFDRELTKMWKHATRNTNIISLLMIDLDDFKLYNDTYGHLAGDDTLRKAAEVLENQVNRSTDTVARYGGEEFSVILPGTDSRGARKVAQDILTAFDTLGIEHTSGVKNKVTVSIGIATFAPSANDVLPLKLVEIADRALYKAKAAGKAIFVVLET